MLDNNKSKGGMDQGHLSLSVSFSAVQWLGARTTVLLSARRTVKRRSGREKRENVLLASRRAPI